MSIQSNQLHDLVRSLIEKLSTYQKAYYIDNKPLVSDMEYDRLFDQLTALEKEYPSLRFADSPTNRVGSDLDSSFDEVSHTIPVLSLDKAYTQEELISWIGKTQKRVSQQLGVIIEEKIDGISIVLYYEQGVLIRAVTRGNGSVGNDVTANVKTIATVPLRLAREETLAVRGEVYLSKNAFIKLNEELETPFANPRNLAAGTIRRIKSSEVAKVPLQMFVYEGFWEDGKTHADHLSVLAALHGLGFPLNKNIAFFSQDKQTAELALHEAGLEGFSGSFSDIAHYIEKQIESRASLPYEIDGLVAKVNELEARKQLGYTEHHPRWALAYKFESPQAQTVLQEIDLQVGRTGRITPVARVNPVKVAGSTIKNITLHNQEYINMLELGLGDVVEISRRGDVIPAVERVIEKNVHSSLTYRLPESCPVCNTSLVVKGAHHFCPNEYCPAQVKGRVEFFIGKDGMDIENFGPETASFLIELGLIKDVPDIYRIDYKKVLADQKGFGEKKILLLEKGVQKSKEQPFKKVLVALGIPELGKKGADLLISGGLSSMDLLLEVSRNNDIDRLTQIKQIGEKSARLYIQALQDEAMLARLQALKELGLSMQAEQERESSDTPLQFLDQVWCVTGSFDHFNPRSKALEEVEKRGGRTVSSVTSKTTHLLAGRNAGSKLAAAQKLGVAVVDEAQFLAMLKSEVKREEVQGEFFF
ncbi:MAG: DNA ligase (NAD(+)) LigA [Spirochaetia bacterium]|nr:DNA ligase (NAD(+)) LigA [Spirochaetia bacterium]